MYSDYMQNCMMLLKECRHTLEYLLGIIRWADHEHIQKCSVTWLEFYSAFFVKLFLPSIYSSVDFWSSMFCMVLTMSLQIKTEKWSWDFFYDESVKGTFFVHNKMQTLIISCLLSEKFALNFVERWKFGLQWDLQSSCYRCKGSKPCERDRKVQNCGQGSGKRFGKFGWMRLS